MCQEKHSWHSHYLSAAKRLRNIFPPVCQTDLCVANERAALLEVPLFLLTVYLFPQWNCEVEQPWGAIDSITSCFKDYAILSALLTHTYTNTDAHTHTKASMHRHAHTKTCTSTEPSNNTFSSRDLKVERISDEEIQIGI